MSKVDVGSTDASLQPQLRAWRAAVVKSAVQEREFHTYYIVLSQICTEVKLFYKP